MKRSVRSQQSGFSMVEILVVVLILGILAGISFAVFGGARSNAKDQHAQRAVVDAMEVAQAYWTGNKDRFYTSNYRAGDEVEASDSQAETAANTAAVNRLVTSLQRQLPRTARAYGVTTAGDSGDAVGPTDVSVSLEDNQTVTFCSKSVTKRVYCMRYNFSGKLPTDQEVATQTSNVVASVGNWLVPSAEAASSNDFADKRFVSQSTGTTELNARGELAFPGASKIKNDNASFAVIGWTSSMAPDKNATATAPTQNTQQSAPGASNDFDYENAPAATGGTATTPTPTTGTGGTAPSGSTTGSGSTTPPTSTGGTTPTAPAASCGGPNYKNAVLADDPVSYYRFNESSTGLLAPIRDTSGNNIFGAYVAGVRSTGGATGDCDTAVSVNGLGGTLGIPNISTSWAIEYWIKTTSPNGFQALSVTGTLITATNNQSQFTYCGVIDLLCFRNTGVSGINNGQWHHIVLTRDTSARQIRFYLDGVKKDTASISFLTSILPYVMTTPIIGTDGNPASYDEMAFYNRSLSDARVTAHYNAR